MSILNTQYTSIKSHNKQRIKGSKYTPHAAPLHRGRTCGDGDRCEFIACGGGVPDGEDGGAGRALIPLGRSTRKRTRKGRGKDEEWMKKKDEKEEERGWG